MTSGPGRNPLLSFEPAIHPASTPSVDTIEQRSQTRTSCGGRTKRPIRRHHMTPSINPNGLVRLELQTETIRPARKASVDTMTSKINRCISTTYRGRYYEST